MANDHNIETTSVEKRHFLRLELKDVIQFGAIIASVTLFYFAQVRDSERRLTILETKMQSIEANISELRSDTKAILSTVKGGMK